eukprot:6006873-Amphidinium_carterae.1
MIAIDVDPLLKYGTERSHSSRHNRSAANELRFQFHAWRLKYCELLSPHCTGHDMRESYDVELDESSAPTSALHLFMAISACEAVEERCHQQCLPPPEDIVLRLATNVT